MLLERKEKEQAMPLDAETPWNQKEILADWKKKDEPAAQ
jgi:hypothetical protein